MQGTVRQQKLACAFTLIELLVVIAIIAILAAILFPVFARARESARRTVCTSNLRQLAQAMAMYTQDFDERFPVCNFTDNVFGFPPQVHVDATGKPIFMIELLQPYTRNKQIFVCPTMRGQTGRTQFYPTDYNFLCVHGWSIVPGFTDFNNDLQGVCDHALSEIGRSAEKPMIVCDGIGEHVGERSNDVFAKGRLGGQNIAYVDGHVKLTPGTYQAIVALYKAPNN
jgi:prepilin-type N-terminal cleavage/methylation domain-containing protein/prepilin-type processing-associated H-X9-DG protein